MSLTDEKLARLRAAAARAADGWSPTSSSWAALEHCAEASPVAVMAMCERIEELEATAQFMWAKSLKLEAERDAWRRMAHRCFKQSVAKGGEVATLREGLRALEAERDGMAKALELARAELAKLRDAESQRVYEFHEEMLT